MKIQTGYLYHIKDEFFNKINNEKLMINHENGKTHPTYFTIKDGDVLWFVPLSSKVAKYEPIIESKKKKYGSCKTIIIDRVLEKKSVILLQNAFPTLEKYIDHLHTVNGKAAKVSNKLKKEILNNFKYMMRLKSQGINLFFADVDSIKEKIIEELKISV